MKKLSKKNKIILSIVGGLSLILICLLIVYKVSIDRISSSPKADANTSTIQENDENQVETVQKTNDNTQDETDSAKDFSSDSFSSEETSSSLSSDEDASSASEEESPSYSPVTVCFTGDVELSEGVQQGYDKNGIDGVLSPMMQDLLINSDITFVNNEFCFSTRGEKAPDKQFTFRVDPKYVDILKDMGVDMVTLANNHSLDYGTDALIDTFDTLDNAGITYIGAGDSLSRASELKTIEKEGITFGFLSASRVIPVTSWDVANGKPGVFTTYDSTRLNAAIAEAKNQVDYLVVYVHWGIERDTYPQEYERTLAKEYIDNGADIVIGTHPHVLQGIEYYNGKPIFYSLGNYIFNSSIASTAVLSVTVQKNDNDIQASYMLTPGHAGGYITQVDEGEAGVKILDYIESISTDVDISDDGYISPQDN